MYILGVETSCDETAASVVADGRDILSNIISSSLRYHKRFGGVIPEIATRRHTENIDRVIRAALKRAGTDISDISAIAVTQGPGLSGALLVGISCAGAMAYALKRPLVAVDHLKAHIYSALMEADTPRFPFIGLVISGGHTQILMVRDYDRFEMLGETLDDAAGEAYDKVARILGLGYPGGPVIERLARRGERDALKFTCRAVGRSLNFSFSGIKTAVLYYAERHNLKWPRKKRLIYDVAASFQEAVLKVIVENTVRAIKKYDSAALVIGGGVSANSRFREMIREEGARRGFKAFFPPFSLCSDNAAMIAGLAYHMLEKGRTAGPAITAYT